MMRREFALNGAVRSARAHASSLGLYELHLNGHIVGDQVLAPGWTSYNKRIQYQTHEVKGMLHEGLNAVDAILGDGWYRGYLGWIGKRNVYGEKLGLILEMRILYEDGIVKSAWNMEENWFDISLAPNTYGTVRLPGVKLGTLTENGKPVQEIEGVQMVEEKNDEVILKIGSGRYHFEITH